MDEYTNIEDEHVLNLSDARDLKEWHESLNVSGKPVSDNGLDEAAKLNKSAHDWEYDAAISATGFGRYNFILFLASAGPYFAYTFTTNNISFILPSAECDLNLSNFDKGLLVAATYVGMLISGFSTGFLSDTFGRRKLLVVSLSLDALFNICAGLAQSYFVMLIAKLFTGFICSAPYTTTLVYLFECSPDRFRSQITILSGGFVTAAYVFLSLSAWVILPLQIEPLWPGIFDLPPWRLFLLFTALPSFLSAISFYFLQESPKFLLAKGRHDEALACLRHMFAMNKREPANHFPVLSLRIDKKIKYESQKTFLESLSQGMHQIRPLFKPPYVKIAILVYFFELGSVLVCNTLRTWLPQLFSYVVTAEKYNVTEVKSLCDMISYSIQHSYNRSSDIVSCNNVHKVDEQLYIKTMILGAMLVAFFIICGFALKYIGDKILLVITTVLSVVSCIAIYLGTTSNLMMISAAVLIAMTSISSIGIFSVAIPHFPTEFSSLALSLATMFGYIGGVVGNLAFSLLLDLSCVSAFVFFAVVIVGTGLPLFAIPKVEPIGSRQT